MATAAKAKTGAVPFGSREMYTSGGGLAEGDYVWKELKVQMYQAPANQQSGKQSPARLGVMITLLPLPSGEETTQFYSMGTKAHESFAPNPETGKGIVQVPGGPASTFNDKTNWAILHKSLLDSGLPEGIFVDDLGVLEGMHVHMANVPEPAERAGFQSQTGEVAGERKIGTIAVVTEIKDDGKPWEGTGGVPEEAPAKTSPKGKAAPTVGKPATTSPKAGTATTASPTDEVDPEVYSHAGVAVSSILEKNPKGIKKLQLRTGTFKYFHDAKNPDMAQAVINTYFNDDKVLDLFLQELGYTLKGIDVVPA